MQLALHNRPQDLHRNCRIEFVEKGMPNNAIAVMLSC